MVCVTALLEGGGGQVCADTIFHSRDLTGGEGSPRWSLWVLGGSGRKQSQDPWMAEDILGLAACNGSLMGKVPYGHFSRVLKPSLSLLSNL